MGVEAPALSPELYVYDRVMDRIGDTKGMLAVALHRRYEDADRVEDVAWRSMHSGTDCDRCWLRSDLNLARPSTRPSCRV